MNYWALAAIIDEKIFCVHSGLSVSMYTVEKIDTVISQFYPDSESQILVDFAINIPSKNHTGWSIYGGNYGYDVVETFLKKNNFELI